MTDLRKAAEMALNALKLVYEQTDFSNGVTDPTGTIDEGKVVIGGIVSDAIAALESELAKPEQTSTEPPDYVEPPTSDYHNGWEEGFEAAKNLLKGKNK